MQNSSFLLTFRRSHLWFLYLRRHVKIRKQWKIHRKSVEINQFWFFSLLLVQTAMIARIEMQQILVELHRPFAPISSEFVIFKYKNHHF